MTISISADGEYRYDDGMSSSALRCDGKYRPIGKSRTEACVKGGASLLELTRKKHGVKTNEYQWKLSTDGKILTTTATEFRPNGPVVTSRIIFSRLSGSDGLAGQWRDTIYLQQHADMTLRLDNQALHIDYPSAGQQIDASLDGVEGPVRGPHAPEGTTFAVRPAGNRKFLTVTKRRGRVFSEGSLELSNDGKSIIDTWWNPDRPNVKGTLVYEKQ